MFQEAFNVYQMFQTRYALHRRAYQHRVVHAVELMSVFIYTRLEMNYKIKPYQLWMDYV